MAKQTFTTGQVLTAAQMTSLQQTAMGGGSTTAKTTSYVLVAADAGTVVQMNSASATTITVNTALFAAGDTVQIQNIGAGVCTVTAGTATVNTAGSLALSQYEGGQLYFNTTSAALFFDIVQSSSPLTTKGDVYTFSTVDARLGVGANDTVLTADSTAATGLKWAAPTTGGMTLLASGTLSGTSVSLTSIAATYKNLIVYLRNYNNSGGTNDAVLGVNSNTVSVSIEQRNNAGTYQVQSTIVHTIAQNVSNTASNAHAYILIPDYASANVALAQSISYTKSSNTTNSNLFVTSVFPATVAAISSVQLNSASTWGGGTYELWGQK